jgi:hypothetical protein
LLKTRVHTQAVGKRPLVEMEPTDHPLAVEQRTGITLARVQEIAETLLHRLPGLPAPGRRARRVPARRARQAAARSGRVPPCSSEASYLRERRGEPFAAPR